MRKLITYLFFTAACTQSVAQIEIDRSIDLDGASNADKQVENVGEPTDPDHAVPAFIDQQGVMIYAEATGTDTLVVSLTPGITAYEPGLQLNVLAPNENENRVYLNVDGLGEVEVLVHVNRSIDSAQVRAGQILSVIYDGNNFQLLSELERPCIAGFEVVNEQYCIETAEAVGNDWYWDAVAECYDRNARLCTWAEWYYACQHTGLTVAWMTNNWEWTSTVANNVGQVKIVGGGDCEVGLMGRTADQQFRRRCCYSR